MSRSAEAPAGDCGPGADELAATLATVRDWLRHAVGCFSRAGLAYGHGTDNALDEAAFIILETLRLPIDDINPWLDARLLISERHALAAAIGERVATRRPAAYIVGAAYINGHRFLIDERVIVPRSYLGELLAAGELTTALGAAEPPQRVLDLCTGSGCLAILAALAFPDAAVDATDISAEALEVASVNVGDYGLTTRIRLLQGDLFAPLAGRRYDLVLANPPYVAAAEMAAFPPEHRAEPALAHAGGEDGLDLVRRILAAAADHLEPAGLLVMEIGTGRPRLEAGLAGAEVMWLDSEASEGEVLAIDATALEGLRRAGMRKVPARARGARKS